LYDRVLQAGPSDPSTYNSPAAAILVLQELTRMLWLVKDGRDRFVITALHDRAWKDAALHFHAPTQQWAGPQGDTDETNLAAQPPVFAFLQRVCGRAARFDRADLLALSLETWGLLLQCPRHWTHTFAKLTGSRQLVETFEPADPAVPGAHNPVVGTTWLH